MKNLSFEIGILFVGLAFWGFAEVASSFGYLALIIILPVGIVAAGIMVHFSKESNKRR